MMKLYYVGRLIFALTFPIIIVVGPFFGGAFPRALSVLVYRYLDVGQTPYPADIMVVLGGHQHRVATAAQLYEQGIAPKILVGGSPLDISKNLEQLRNYQVPDEVIIVMPPTESTWEEAQSNLAYLRGAGLASVLLITTRAHTRRAKAVYEALNHDASFDLQIVSAVWDSIDETNWWRNHAIRHLVIREYVKIGYYFLQYEVKAWD